MSNLTRRAILRGSATVAVAASLPSALTTEADPVLSLVDRWRALNAEMIALCRPTGLAYPVAADHEEAIADLNDRMIAVEGEIAATAATSFAGLHAKLMVAAFETGTNGPSIAQAYAGERSAKGSTEYLAASAWADAERLAGKGGAA